MCERWGVGRERALALEDGASGNRASNLCVHAQDNVDVEVEIEVEVGVDAGVEYW